MQLPAHTHIHRHEIELTTSIHQVCREQKYVDFFHAYDQEETNFVWLERHLKMPSKLISHQPLKVIGCMIDLNQISPYNVLSM